MKNKKEPILNDDAQRVYNKEEESYDTVKDKIVGGDTEEENVEAEYEGLTPEDLDDKPLY